MRALRRSSTATATVAAADRVTASARRPPPVFPRRRRAGRRDRRPARNIQLERNACIARLERGGRHRRGRRPGHRQRPNAAAGFPMPSPRGPPPANRRDRRPARNAQPGRNARIAQLEHGGRHRRGRRPVTASARTPPPVFQSRRRAGRRPRTVATAAPRRTPSQGAMHALRGSTSAAATVAAPAFATAGARTPPPIVPRSRSEGPAHRGTPGQVRRSRCARAPMAAATVAAPNPGTAPPPTAFSILPAPSHRRAVYRIRATGQVSHITTGPRASSVFHNQHRCGKRRAADALAMSIHRSVGPDPWICGKPAWHNHRPRSEFST